MCKNIFSAFLSIIQPLPDLSLQVVHSEPKAVIQDKDVYFTLYARNKAIYLYVHEMNKLILFFKTDMTNLGIDVA